MQINDIRGCCSVQEIAYLRQQYDASGAIRTDEQWTEVKAMQDLCAGLKTWGPDNRLATPSGFYVFTAYCATGESLGTADEKWVRNPLQYGERFKSFIEEHNLGTVTASNEKPNRKVHPNHMVRVYVWEPEYERLQTWYRANLEVIPPKPTPKPAPAPVATPSAFTPTETFTVTGTGGSYSIPQNPQPAPTPTTAQPTLAETMVAATARRRLVTGLKVRKMRTIRETAAAKRAAQADPSRKAVK